MIDRNPTSPDTRLNPIIEAENGNMQDADGQEQDYFCERRRARSVSTSPSSRAQRTLRSSRSVLTSLSSVSRLLIWSTRFCRYRRAARVLAFRFSTRATAGAKGLFLDVVNLEYAEDCSGEDEIRSLELVYEEPE